MSGIAGIVNLDGAPVDRELLTRMTEFMSFRGPDGQEIWTEGSVGFGQALLRTAGEEQTFSFGNDVWITADARIDGSENTDLTDVERIVRAYE
jgi:asparagine synthase (glutamine-hydrolysing)